MEMPPGQYWYCTLTMAILYMSGLCSTLFILNMTFERFYSIIKPHKAASLNTVKRAKITIACIILFSTTFNCPHFFITSQRGKECIPFGKASSSIIGQFYHWFSMVLNFAVPFVLLLIMNSFIIHKIRNRPQLSDVRSQGQGQCQGQGQGQVCKNKKFRDAGLYNPSFSNIWVFNFDHSGICIVYLHDVLQLPEVSLCVCRI